uniref:S-adenosyl-L-methionine-dependent methyltransferase n=1 Tax=Mucochytrium quahogii TaxID=96639 RepID=A0A7S2RJK8_9STRA|mmetsp:Transcript_30284/g.48191  ORF Transcript_30284/g.48191 Transcript_30284/m.48191 type:complete len:321 (+) Transcript_30284:588-1550(+)
MSMLFDDEGGGNGPEASVINTSYLGAMERARCKYVDDPFAEKLAGPEGKKMCELADDYYKPYVNMMTTYVGARTVYLDSLIKDFVKNGGAQLVVMGAGLDSHAFRLQELASCKVFEVDFPHIFSIKNERLENAKPVCLERKEIPLDVSKGNWDSLLIDAGFDKAKLAFFLVGGFLMYLSEDDNLDVIRKISKISVKGSLMAGDWMAMTELHAYRPRPLDLVRFVGEKCQAQFLWSTKNLDDLESFLGAEGIEIVETVDENLYKPQMRKRISNILGYSPKGYDKPKLPLRVMLWGIVYMLMNTALEFTPKVSSALYLAKKK